MISRRNKRKLRRRAGKVFAEPQNADLDPSSVLLIQLGRSLTGEQFFLGNTVEVFTDGQEKFNALERDICAAKHSINIQYYIFEDDNIGNRLAKLLAEKAAAGVKVRLIYDHVGSFHVRSRFFKNLRKRGIEAHPFFKVSFPWWGTRINWRNHRKIVVIDETIGYLGGMNVADRYIDGGKKFDSWRDTHVRVTGPVVAALQYSFAVDWNFMGGGLIDDHCYDNDTSASAGGINTVSNVGIQMLTSGPTSQWSNIALTLQKAIANAKERVYVQTPYFLPNEAILRALQAAALAHVDVRIMVPRRADSYMLTQATASYFTECLRSGIKIYLYTAGMLHSKCVIVDDEFVSIGSTNFDFRSFDYNFEANLFFYSPQFNQHLTEIFHADLRHCERVIAARWRKRRLSKRMAESVLRLLSPVL